MKSAALLKYYAIFWAIAQVVYAPNWNAGFVSDFTGLLHRFDGRGAADILNCFGFPALQQVLNAFLYGFYSLFGTSPLPWHLMHTSLHALNALLLLGFGRALLRRMDVSGAKWASLAAALLFLLSPYASEPVTWRVCANFLLSTACLLSIAWLTLRWQARPRGRLLWPLHGLFLLGLFTFELLLIAPFMTLLLLLMLPQPKPRQLLWVSLPQAAAVAGYFLLNKWLLGAWIGHYGAEVHLKFEWPQVLANVFRYPLKHWLFVRDWPHEWKSWLFDGLATVPLIYGLSALVGLLIAFALWRYPKRSGRSRALLLCLLLGGLALGPIINLYFYYLHHIVNDRYGYLPSAFLYLGLATALTGLPRYAYTVLLSAWIAVSIGLLWRTNQLWAQSTIVYNRLLDEFRWHDAPAVYFLNLPDNFQGALLFREMSRSGEAFKDALKYNKGRPYTGQAYTVAQYNMTRLSNGATAEVDSSGQIRVELEQWGTWWWSGSIGMGPGYRTETYEVDSKGHHYFLRLDTVPPGSVFLLQRGLEWEELQGINQQ